MPIICRISSASGKRNLPYCISIGASRIFAPRLRDEIAQLRDRLDDLPFGEERAELVARAAFDARHFALDHLRRHAAALPGQRDQPLGLGDRDAHLRNVARELVGEHAIDAEALRGARRCAFASNLRSASAAMLVDRVLERGGEILAREVADDDRAVAVDQIDGCGVARDLAGAQQQRSCPARRRA